MLNLVQKSLAMPAAQWNGGDVQTFLDTNKYLHRCFVSCPDGTTLNVQLGEVTHGVRPGDWLAVMPNGDIRYYSAADADQLFDVSDETEEPHASRQSQKSRTHHTADKT